MSITPSSPHRQRIAKGYRLLADEKYVDSTEIEIVVEGQRGEALIGRVLASIELELDIAVSNLARGLRSVSLP